MTQPMSDNKVVLPEPEGPMIRVTFPVESAMDEGLRATMTLSPLMNSFDAAMTSAMTDMAVSRGSYRGY
jgi:hypothetical protein